MICLSGCLKKTEKNSVFITAKNARQFLLCMKRRNDRNEELEKYIVRKDDEVTRILFAYEINAEGNMEWHKITKDMASKWKKDLNDVTDLPEK